MELRRPAFNIVRAAGLDQDFAMTDAPSPPNAAPGKALPPAAVRALEEAAARRAAAEQEEAKAKELGGPSGAEPTRFGDWERKGVAVDF